MARQRRFHVPGGIYHVTLRGNHRQPIFLGDGDYLRLERLLAEVVEAYDLRIHSYCWMPNHLHLAIQVGDQALARPLQRLASRYARGVQARLQTTGHFFERRYHAVLVDSERYLFALVRYIHLNPVRAKIVARPEMFHWSSHNAYLGGFRPAWLTTDMVSSRLSSDVDEARIAYRRIMQELPSVEETEHLRRGSSDVTHSVPVPAVTRSSQNRPKAARLDQLIVEVCAQFGVDPAALAAPGKGRVQTVARALIVWRATTLGLETMSGMSARLGRSVSSLSEGLRSVRKRHQDLFENPNEIRNP